MNVTNKEELQQAKNHLDAFGSLPLETMTRIFELAGEQLEPSTVTVDDDKVVTKKTTKQSKA